MTALSLLICRLESIPKSGMLTNSLSRVASDGSVGQKHMSAVPRVPYPYSPHQSEMYYSEARAPPPPSAQYESSQYPAGTKTQIVLTNTLCCIFRWKTFPYFSFQQVILIPTTMSTHATPVILLQIQACHHIRTLIPAPIPQSTSMPTLAPIMDTLHTTMAVATQPTAIPKHSPHGRKWSEGVRTFPRHYSPKAPLPHTCRNQLRKDTPQKTITTPVRSGITTG